MEAMKLASASVVYHQEPEGTWWAEADQVPGFTAFGETLAEVRELVRTGIPFYAEDPSIEISEQYADGTPVVALHVSTPELHVVTPRWDFAWTGIAAVTTTGAQSGEFIVKSHRQPSRVQQNA